MDENRQIMCMADCGLWVFDGMNVLCLYERFFDPATDLGMYSEP
jgi:hypothetical protein